MLEIIQPGLLTTVQDAGRPGHYAIGLPPSGALDLYGHAAANALVGNEINAATLEITFMGPRIRFAADTWFAVSGDVTVTLAGDLVACWTTLRARAGEELTFGMMTAGTRAYLAVQGGIAVPLVFGSRSTYVQSGVGGHEGRQLRAGDKLAVGSPVGPAPEEGSAVPAGLRTPRIAADHPIRIVLGLCSYRFTDGAIEEFLGSPYRVTPEANRTGYRFSGPALRFVEREQPFGAGSNPSNVVDLGYPIGSIQVPNGEEPICLHRDAVTGGGYATIGTVISADLDLLAQMKTPDTVRFHAVTRDEAMAARHSRATRLQRLRNHLTKGTTP